MGTKGWRVLGGASGAVVEEGRLVEIGRPSLWAMRWLMDGMVETVRRGSLVLLAAGKTLASNSGGGALWAVKGAYAGSRGQTRAAGASRGQRRSCPRGGQPKLDEKPAHKALPGETAARCERA